MKFLEFQCTQLFILLLCLYFLILLYAFSRNLFCLQRIFHILQVFQRASNNSCLSLSLFESWVFFTFVVCVIHCLEMWISFCVLDNSNDDDDNVLSQVSVTFHKIYCDLVFFSNMWICWSKGVMNRCY